MGVFVCEFFIRIVGNIRGGYEGGGHGGMGAWGHGAWGTGAPPLLVLKIKSPADITYDCRGISGLMSTIALAVANTSLQVSMTILS